MEMKINSDMTSSELVEAVKKVSQASHNTIEVVFVARRSQDDNYSFTANCSPFTIIDACNMLNQNLLAATKKVYELAYEQGKKEADTNENTGQILDLNGRRQ